MSATGSPNSPADRRPAASRAGPQCLALNADATLDARRAIYFPNAQTVAVADLHLGYAWVQRKRGALLPVSAPDSTYSRLASLLANYPVRELVVLGDLVHQALGLPQIEEALRALAAVVSRDITLTLCAGNHDQKLANLVLRWKLPLRIVSALSVGRYLLHHGDGKPNESDFRLDSGDRVHVIGHEHPALRLGDGVATSAKVPCFLVSDDVVVVPAFSDWAAGCVYLRDRFLGEVAQRATFHAAYACMGPRLLKFPLR